MELWRQPFIVGMSLLGRKMLKADVVCHKIVSQPGVKFQLLLVLNVVLDNLNKKSYVKFEKVRNFNKKFVKFEFVWKIRQKVR